jgi:sirohydrochlorin ferrochelatase
MTPAPALVGISHGTSSDAGQRAVVGLITAVAEAHPELVVAQGFVDVQHPDTSEALGALDADLPAIVVPLLLSAGYHVHVDLTDAVALETEREVILARPLGPDERLVQVLQDRLAEVEFGTDDLLVLAVAGSSDTRAVADCRSAALELSTAVGREVVLGFLSAAEPRLDAAIAEARAKHPGRRVVVSSYLLAPGYFHDLAAAAGGDVTTAPLLVAEQPAPPQIADIVVDRYRAALPVT